MQPIRKYPRTNHLEGSALQPGDEELQIIPFRWLAGRNLVVEEKLDGANCGVSFGVDGRLLLQSRGHYLLGGPREGQWSLFKAWAGRYQAELWDLLGERYIMYGEWLYAKHTLFYNALPHYFLEFDIYDTAGDAFLDLARRQQLLRRAPFVVSVPTLHEGSLPSLQALRRLIGPSRCIDGDHLAALREVSAAHGLDADQVLRETDPSTLMEGLYIKVEEGGSVAERYKYVRPGFRQQVSGAGSHWLDRPLLPNQLRPDVDLF